MGRNVAAGGVIEPDVGGDDFAIGEAMGGEPGAGVGDDPRGGGSGERSPVVEAGEKDEGDDGRGQERARPEG